MKIYRFVDFSEFKRLFNEKTLILKRPQLWKDPYEGFPFRYFEKEDGKAIVYEYFEKNKIQLYDDILSILKDSIYCLCFTKTAESEAMWKSYEYDKKSIRITFDFDEIKDIENKNKYFKFVNVKYCNKDMLKKDLREYLKLIIYNKNNQIKFEPYNGFIIKRKDFIHENECRLLFYNTDNLLVKNNITKTKIYKLGNGSVEKHNISDIYKIDMVKNNIHINGIFLHPEYNESDSMEIQQFCSKNEIQYLGKSKLYTFE